MTVPPEVTVVVPVHDVAPYLDDCVASIAGQTEQRIELVLVDDGSSDGSGELCDEWGVRDPRIRVLHQPPQGSSVARNAGVAAATGHYITFVDSDDVVSTELVAHLLGAVEQTGADIALGEFAEFHDGDTVPFTTGTSLFVSSASDELMQIMCVRPQWGPVVKLFRRDLFDEGTRFPEGLLHQDLAFTPRIFGRASRVVRTDAVLYGYRQRPGSVTDNVRRVAFSPDLITILGGNIELARVTQPPPTYERYLLAYLLHARKHIERLRDRGAWRRNAPFVNEYRALVRQHLEEVRSAPSIGAVQCTAFAMSARWPRAYVMALDSARRLTAVLRRGPRRFGA